MNLKLYYAISADGYIASESGDVSWISSRDESAFKEEVEDAGCVIVGRNAFDKMQNTRFNMTNAMRIVVTHDDGVQNEAQNLYATSQNTQDIIKSVETLGRDSAILAGGSDVAGQFLNERLIDEIILSVHPVILSRGLDPFSDAYLRTIKLDKLDSALDLTDDVTQIRYRVVY